MPLLNKDSASTEQTLLYAQRIIDFFSSSTRGDGCLTQIPITLFNEADHHIDKVESFLDIINNKPSGVPTNTFQNDPISAAIRRSIGSDCLDCKPKMPTVNFSGMKGLVHLDAKDFMGKMNAAFNLKSSIEANLPSLAFLLGSFCIPDLIKLLSLLLASLIRINFSLDFSKFSFMALLTAILKQLLGSLLSFSNASISFSLSPIMCVLDALAQLSEALSASKKQASYGLSISQLGVEVHDRFVKEKADAMENQEAAKTKLKEKEPTTILLGTKVISKSISTKYAGKVSKIVDKIQKNGERGKDPITRIVKDMTTLINSALSDIEISIFEIFQIGQAITCESERSTSKVSDEIGKVLQYIAIINLIRSVIKKKTRNVASQVVGTNGSLAVASDTKFSNSDIAEIVGEVTNSLVEIAQTADGNMGILIKEDPANNINQPLTMYGCNLDQFIKESHMDNIIEDAKTFAETNLLGQGNNPTYFSNDYIVVENSNNFLPFNIDTDDLLVQVSDILKFLNIKNPYEPDVTPEDVQSLAGKATVHTGQATVHTGQTIIISPTIDNILGDIGNIRI